MSKSTVITVTGDFCPINRTEALIDNENYSELFNDLLPCFEQSDYNITNLECPIYEGESPIDKIGPNLKAKEKSLAALKFLGINIVTLANNHIMDHGDLGLRSTLSACKKYGIDCLGAGENLTEAAKPFFVEKHGIRIAILNVCENEFGIATEDAPGANGFDMVKNYYHIKEAREKSDFLLLIIHGGHEYYRYPSPRMLETYRCLIDQGVDCVISHHTHCPSGYETYNGGKIFYGLGNFVFDWKKKKLPSWYVGYAVQICLSPQKEISFKIIPYLQNEDEVGVRLLKDEESDFFFGELNQINEIISNRALIEEKWSQLVDKNVGNYVNSLMPISNKYFNAFLSKANLKIPLSKKSRLKIMNLVRCESHKDLFISALKRLY